MNTRSLKPRRLARREPGAAGLEVTVPTLPVAHSGFVAAADGDGALDGVEGPVLEGRDVAVDGVAALAHGLHERTVLRIFQTDVGMSFGRWRQQMHIIQALQRLSAGLSVQRTAEDLGYESVSAFITMFRKTLGKTPARYFADKSDPQATPP